MKDFLRDLIKHTSGLGFLETVKITCEDGMTLIDGVSDDKAVVLRAVTHQPVDGFDGIFGIPNISKLNAILNLEPYAENEVIELKSKEVDGVKIPTNVHFENSDGTFQNDHRFMNTEVILEKLRKSKFNEPSEYDIIFEPLIESIKLMGFQASISDEEVFSPRVDKEGLTFLFGDHSTHAGEFLFHPKAKGKMSNGYSWFVSNVLPILKLSGKTTMQFSDRGLLKITVDSGLCTYNYIVPAVKR